MDLITWSFMDKPVYVTLLGEKVAYSWTCGKDEDLTHIHTIGCLWIWHDCDANLAQAQREYRDEDGRPIYLGWKPTGVAAHTLVTIEPLHIEASIYWPECCGMHGWIRDGKYTSV